MVTQSWFIQSRDVLVENERELRTMARTDPLTGIGNRRLFNEVLEAEWDRAIRTQSTLALLMIDVDSFKAYNDRYGHEAGDRCLQSIALALRVALPRAGDVVARYGGEEFVALLPDTPATNADTVADRLREHVASLGLPHEASTHGLVTISIGLSATRPARGDLYQRLVNDADRALYVAKADGRNRSVLHES
jgi:diguanylate cyclase (GGDEF)-like protein